MLKAVSHTFLALALASQAPVAEAQNFAPADNAVSTSQQLIDALPADMSSQSRFMAEYILTQQCERHFVMIYKVSAVLYVFENGRVVDEGPVLLGQNTGDMRSLSDRAVPAGQFRVIPRQGPSLEEKGYRRGQFLEFYCEPGRPGRISCAGLHAVWTEIPAERRIERLESATIEDNYITNGCPNVLNPLFDSAWNMITDPYNVNTEGRTPYIYVLNEEDSSLQGTATFFGIPQDYLNAYTMRIGQAPVMTAEIR